MPLSCWAGSPAGGGTLLDLESLTNAEGRAWLPSDSGRAMSAPRSLCCTCAVSSPRRCGRSRNRPWMTRCGRPQGRPLRVLVIGRRSAGAAAGRSALETAAVTPVCWDWRRQAVDGRCCSIRHLGEHGAEHRSRPIAFLRPDDLDQPGRQLRLVSMSAVTRHQTATPCRSTRKPRPGSTRSGDCGAASRPPTYRDRQPALAVRLKPALVSPSS